MSREYDENSAREQVDTPAPNGRHAAAAQGVAGDEPPPETEAPRLERREESAAGFTSIYETAKHGFGEMGVARTVSTLLKLNQKDGFDCPSCAWPDPDGERKVAEFCENGAKAVASEATRKRVTPEFFAEHTIADLLAQSDLWMDQQGRLTHPMVRRP